MRKTSHSQSRARGVSTLRYAGAVLGLVAGGVAQAFPLETDNPDLVINWDQTVRYNVGTRVKNIDLAGPASTTTRDESEFVFKKGDVVMNRVDLYSEFDVAYQRRLGLRVSAGAWYDAAYGNKGKSNPALAGLENYPNNEFSPYIKRYYKGLSGEFIDAFVWGNLDLPAGTANVKLGRLAQLWGEAIGGTASANSVASSMAPVDGQKQALSPGATAKETVLPIAQLAGTIPIVKDLTLSAQYALEYRASRAPEGGTFLGLNDLTISGPVRTLAGPTALFRQDPLEGRKGDLGLMLRYSPNWLGGDTIGLVARKYDDKTLGYQQVSVPNRFYRLVANRDVKLVGLTYGTSVLGASVGAELNVRNGQGLAGSLNAATLQPARGNTIHGLVNATKAFGQTPLWDTLAVVGEVSWMKLRKITENAANYQGNAAACATQDITAGCPTKNAYHMLLSVVPGWQQVFPSVDLSMPVTYSRGLKGNGAAIGSAINEGSGVFAIGLSATIHSRHTLALTYTNFFNKHRGTGATYVNNGASANYDKDWIGLSYQTNF